MAQIRRLILECNPVQTKSRADKLQFESCPLTIRQRQRGRRNGLPRIQRAGIRHIDSSQQIVVQPNQNPPAFLRRSNAGIKTGLCRRTVDCIYQPFAGFYIVNGILLPSLMAATSTSSRGTARRNYLPSCHNTSRSGRRRQNTGLDLSGDRAAVPSRDRVV